MRIKAAWGDDEVSEYEALISDTLTHSRNLRERVRFLENGIVDAQQAGRPWARDLERAATWHGLTALIKREARTVVSVRGRSVNATVGITRETEDGPEQLQLDLVLLTRDDLIVTAEWYRSQVGAYNRKIATNAALLDLLEKHAEAVTVGDALEAEGLDLQGYLDGYFQEDAA